MDFYNKINEGRENFDNMNSKINSSIEDLNKNWEGPASVKFFSSMDEVKAKLDILNNQISLFEAAGTQIKALEEVNENLKIKKEQLATLEEPDANLSAEVKSLEKQKKELIKEIEEYFDTISSLNTESVFIDLKMSLSKNTIEKAIKINESVDNKEEDNLNQQQEKTVKENVEDNNIEEQQQAKEIIFTNSRITNYNGNGHKGMDFALDTGTPIQSTVSGKVLKVDTLTNPDGSFRSYGKLVVIQDDEGNNHYYAHLSDFECNVGDIVERGTIIGYSGNTGNSTGPHLHYEVRRGDNYNDQIDPQNYLT